MPMFNVKYTVKAKKEIVTGERMVEVEMSYKAGPKVENLIRSEYEERGIRNVNIVIEDVLRVG